MTSPSDTRIGFRRRAPHSTPSKTAESRTVGYDPRQLSALVNESKRTRASAANGERLIAQPHYPVDYLQHHERDHQRAEHSTAPIALRDDSVGEPTAGSASSRATWPQQGAPTFPPPLPAAVPRGSFSASGAHPIPNPKAVPAAREIPTRLHDPTEVLPPPRPRNRWPGSLHVDLKLALSVGAGIVMLAVGATHATLFPQAKSDGQAATAVAGVTLPANKRTNARVAPEVEANRDKDPARTPPSQAEHGTALVVATSTLPSSDVPDTAAPENAAAHATPTPADTNKQAAKAAAALLRGDLPTAARGYESLSIQAPSAPVYGLLARLLNPRSVP